MKERVSLLLGILILNSLCVSFSWAEEPSINGARVYGVQPDRAFVYRIPTSGTRPMTWQIKDLPVGVTLKEGILTGSISKKGNYPLAITAKNADGQDVQTLTLICGDQIALTPPMGWNSWYSYSEAISQEAVEKVARLLVESGLADYGYSFVNIDDCWQGVRGGPYYAIQPNKRFPDMKQMCDTIHALGLKVGIYSTPWVGTYAGFIGGSAPDDKGDYSAHYLPESKRLQPAQFFGRWPGSTEKKLNYVGTWFFDRDVKQWADWGFDYVKVDWKPNDVPTTKRIAKDLAEAQTKRSIVLSLSNAAPYENMSELSRFANLTRSTGDIHDNWGSLRSIGFSQGPWQRYVRPGHYPDPDMLQIGRIATPNQQNTSFRPTRLTQAEQRTQMTLWSMLSAPLLIACDLENIDQFTKDLLCDKQLIAINQDAAVQPAKCVSNKDGIQIWHKLLADGSTAEATFNLNDVETAGIPAHDCTLKILPSPSM